MRSSNRNKQIKYIKKGIKNENIKENNDYTNDCIINVVSWWNFSK